MPNRFYLSGNGVCSDEKASGQQAERVGQSTRITGKVGILNKILVAAVTVVLTSLIGCSTQSHQHTPSNDQKAVVATPATTAATPELKTENGMTLLPGGEFLMGSEGEMPDEAPVHKVSLKSFWIDRKEVTVAEFEKFVKATNYKTDAEKFGWSGVFDVKSGQWTRGDGVNWRNPDGGDAKPNPNEPVTQVSWADAAAYARWAGKRLPTEAEWEYAARGGLVQKKYAWGDTLRPDGKPPANWWQGHFPDKNTGEDGFIGRAPVGSFAPNGYGLDDMIGNVWEWTADWYAEDYYAHSPNDNPTGTKSGDERVIRGGSWMCSENYCVNYRPSARSHTPPDSGLNNLGFRCARDQN